MYYFLRVSLTVISISLFSFAQACEVPASVCLQKHKGSFELIKAGQPATIFVEKQANSALQHVAQSFAQDLALVSSKKSKTVHDLNEANGRVVIIAEAGQSKIIDQLVTQGKLNIDDITGKWEAYKRVVIDSPFAGITQALVVVGADRRGAVFGTYELSEQMGVSPWYWFADVPIEHQNDVYVNAGEYQDAPKVQYRGFFINDEAPSFTTWSYKHFGGLNAKMYTHVFELLLRLKGNYLWPAMWPPKAFNDDDPNNMKLADAMGVVMGTSHHEPLSRAHHEWHRNQDKGITGGKWDYASNAKNLREFWRGGIERMMSKADGQGYESLITVGMRGDGDEAMHEDTATQLLETIVADQRKIIAQVTEKSAEKTPQVWALYKEVQDYYDHGMQVPDDVTLLFADDNWGQIRRLPTTNLERSGGFGVYYHFDYVGVPRNYKWLNTVQIEKTWQQMDLAYKRGAHNIWIVNVGDIKPVEYPLSAFMAQAWNPEAMTLDKLHAYPKDWAQAAFGTKHADKIAMLITRYSQYAARRKPELIDANSFNLGESTADSLDGGEFAKLVHQWQELEQEMLMLKESLSEPQLPAYYQLVEYPIAALSNLYALYYAAAWNNRLAATNDSRANFFADQVESTFARDQQLTDTYHGLLNGKWDGMMAQAHIGYTSWQQPDEQVMPAITRVINDKPSKPIQFTEQNTGKLQPNISAIEGPDFSRAVNNKGLTWKVINHLGRTKGAVTAFPQGQEPTNKDDAVRLEYDIIVEQTGDLSVQVFLVPTLNTTGQATLRFGLSVDDGPMQVVADKLLPAPNATTLQEQRDWNEAVKTNARMLQRVFVDVPKGQHTIKLWRLDDNVVVQKIVASTSPIPLSYLGASVSK